MKGKALTYKLRVKNYNNLYLPETAPFMLGLLVLPEDEHTWIFWSQKEFAGCDEKKKGK